MCFCHCVALSWIGVDGSCGRMWDVHTHADMLLDKNIILRRQRMWHQCTQHSHTTQIASYRYNCLKEFVSLIWTRENIIRLPCKRHWASVAHWYRANFVPLIHGMEGVPVLTSGRRRQRSMRSGSDFFFTLGQSQQKSEFRCLTSGGRHGNEG